MQKTENLANISIIIAIEKIVGTILEIKIPKKWSLPKDTTRYIIQNFKETLLSRLLSIKYVPNLHVEKSEKKQKP